jgi:hypothetical protein
MRLVVLTLLSPLLLPAAVGCAANVSGSPSAGDAEVVTTTSAVVVVERTVNQGNASEGSRAEASARFVRVAFGSSTLEALRAIGASLELPARGTCASLSSLAQTAHKADPAPVIELADVGSVSLEAIAGGETHLVPRQLPDVTDVVSGMVYARATDPALLPAATRYVVHVGGGPGLEPFDVSAIAPADPSDVIVVGENPTGRLVANGASVDLAWPADGTDDLVYADVRPAGVRCTLGDGTGSQQDLVRGSVSTSLMDGAGTVIVHRLHREALVARGVEAGEIRFDFARSIAYLRP